MCSPTESVIFERKLNKQIRTRLQVQSAKQEQVLQTLKTNHEKVLAKRKREVSVEKSRVSQRIIK